MYPPMQLKLLFERPPVQADDVQADEPGRVSVSIGHLEMVDRQIRQAPATATAEICLELDNFGLDLEAMPSQTSATADEQPSPPSRLRKLGLVEVEPDSSARLLRSSQALARSSKLCPPPSPAFQSPSLRVKGASCLRAKGASCLRAKGAS